MNHLAPTRKSVPLCTLVCLAALFATISNAVAQIPTAPGGQGTARPGVIQYAEPGELSMTVNLWGDIRQPGRWLIPRDTDLIELLTVAGGPGLGTADVRFQRRVILKISRDEGQGRGILYENDIASIVAEGEGYPRLREGDVISVETRVRERFGWRDAAAIVGTAATLVLLIDRVVIMTR